MIYEEFEAQMNALGFLVDGARGQAFGQYYGLPVRCMFLYTGKAKTIRKSAKSRRVNVAITVRKEAAAGFLKAARQAVKGIASAEYYNQFPGALYLRVKPVAGLEAALRQVMDALVPVIDQYDMRPEDVCPLCRHGGCDGAALIRNTYQPIHHECLLRYQDAVRQQSERNLSEGSYLSGILGGLAGGIIATIPTIVTILFLQRIFAILMWLIPMGVAYGYKRCNGKRSKAAGPIMIILSLLSLYVMEYAFWVKAFTEWGYSFGAALTTTLPFLLDPTFWVDMTKQAVTELLFLALAIFMAWKPLMESAGGEIRTAAMAVDTYTEKQKTDDFRQ